MASSYAEYFPQFIQKGVANELLDEKLPSYDLTRLGAALKAVRRVAWEQGSREAQVNAAQRAYEQVDPRDSSSA